MRKKLIYDTVIVFNPDFPVYQVQQKNKWGLVNRTNEVIVPIKFQDIQIHRTKRLFDSKGYYFFYVYVKTKKGWTIFKVKDLIESYELTQISDQYFEEIIPFKGQNFLSMVKSNGKYGVFYFLESKLLLPTNYHQIENKINYFGGFPVFTIKATTGEELYVGYNGVHFFEGFEY